MTAMPRSWQYGKQHVFGILVEDVVDDLHAVDEPRVERPNDVGGLPAVDADAPAADQALASQVVECALPAVVGRPSVAPGVQLLQVDRVDAEVLEARLGVRADVVRREDVVEGAVVELDPALVLRRDFRRGVQPAVAVRADRLGEQPLAVSGAVRPGRIEEVASEGDGFGQRLQRLFVVGAGPAAQPPHAVADFREFPTRSRILAIAHGCDGLKTGARCRSAPGPKRRVWPSQRSAFSSATRSASSREGPWPLAKRAPGSSLDTVQ